MNDLKRKVTPTKNEPVTKSIKINSEGNENIDKVNAMKKADLIKRCEELISLNRNLIEENHRLINTNNEHITTI